MANRAKRGRKRQAKKGRELTLDERLAKALNHPMRADILAILQDRALSPVELEEILDSELSKIAYHCRVLLKYDCIEVVSKKQIRGATRTRYRAITRMFLDKGNWDRLSKETRSGISLPAVKEVIDRASAAIEADTFDKRTDRSVVTLKMDADEQGWAEIEGIVRDAYERLTRVECEMANRKGPKFRMTVSFLAYESPDEKEAQGAKAA